MKTVARRLDRLEGRLVPPGRKQFLIVLTDASQKLALDSSRCVQILREAGHLDTSSPNILHILLSGLSIPLLLICFLACRHRW